MPVYFDTLRLVSGGIALEGYRDVKAFVVLLVRANQI
jgi:hypothetical protein